MILLTHAGFRRIMPLAVAGLLAGCHSSRTAFQFAPAVPYASACQPQPAPVAAEASAVPGAAVPPVAPAVALRPLPASVRRLARRLAVRAVPGPTSRPAGTVAPAVALPTTPAEAAVAVRPHRHHAAPARTQESGLGRIALFFLALVLALLAGLGALVSLIPGVSFWGGVGLAAAGLLVLFLLYSLLSGSKKPKRATAPAR